MPSAESVLAIFKPFEEDDTPTAKCETFWCEIVIAGNLDRGRQVCSEFCHDPETGGLCVSLIPAEYIYTGGMESGFVVRLINYPRFPATKSEVFDKAIRLARLLAERCCQLSFSIMTPDKTFYYADDRKGK